MKKQPSTGFTLIELMYGIAIGGLLFAVAVPTISSIVRSSRITSNANDLVASIQLARSEAVKRRSVVRLCRTSESNDPAPTCGSGTGWEAGWIIFVDVGADGTFDAGTDTLLRRNAAFEDALIPDNRTVFITAVGGGTVADEIAYDPNGFPIAGNVGAGGSGLVFCDDRRNDAAGRVLLISPTGRPNVQPLDKAPIVNLSCS